MTNAKIFTAPDLRFQRLADGEHIHNPVAANDSIVSDQSTQSMRTFPHPDKFAKLLVVQFPNK